MNGERRSWLWEDNAAAVDLGPDTSDDDLGYLFSVQLAIFEYFAAHGEDRELFFAWVHSELLDPEAGRATELTYDQFAYWFARRFWDVSPLESNDFRPRPLPPPRRGRPCPCGSGQSFESCCESFVPDLGFTEHLMWPALAQSRSKEFWIEASRSHRMPALGINNVGRYFQDEAWWEALIDLVEPCLSPTRRTDYELLESVHLLCNAYDAVDDTPQREEELLERLARDPDARIRGSVKERLASCLHDRGRRDDAWKLIASVERDTPGEATTAFIELTMLTSEHRFEDAAALAAKRLETVARNPNVDEDALDLIRRFRDDPKRGRDDYYRVTLPDPVNELLDVIDDQRRRPRPTLRWRRLQNTEDDEALRGAHESIVDTKARSLRRRWRRLSGMTSPFSTDLLSGSELDAWLEVDEWLPWLDGNPRAFDDLVVLDDILRLLVWMRPDDDSDDRWTMWLLGRSASALARSWPKRKPGRTPWVLENNRPALRLLWQYIERLRAYEDDLTERFERLYLRLNPNDNHGVRTSLVNRLLTDGRDADALAITDGYPEDLHAEIAYGRVLALFRLGRPDEAADALREAVRYLPHVLTYLLRDLVDKPPIDESGVAVGGEDQAWVYREDMRELWVKTDGMRPWLEAQRQDQGSG